MSLARSVIFDAEIQRPEHRSLDIVIKKHLSDICFLHGAVHTEPPLLLPATKAQLEEHTNACLLDRHGDLLMLPRNGLTPFARLAIQTGVRRIERFHISDVYRARYA